jgi:hypothetical protein
MLYMVPVMDSVVYETERIGKGAKRQRDPYPALKNQGEEG